MRLGPKSCGVLLVAALLVVRATGQTTSSGALSGVVIEKTNAVVPDAAVKITDLDRGTTDSTKTNGEGTYQFSFLRPGPYALTITHSGFREERRTVTIQVGSSVTVNITLQVAETSSEITVSDEAPIIQAENGDVSATVTQKQVSEVPNPGNDLTYAAQLAPGAVMNTDVQSSANFSILGMPGTSYRFTIDGNDKLNPCQWLVSRKRTL
ncbi:MAG: carboxypeptidase-like regulatory domain-containing protein [Bryobacteraceae bacterium]